MMRVLIRNDGTFAIEFTRDGGIYRTMWTRWRAEVDAWAESIATAGWCICGRPYRFAVDDLDLALFDERAGVREVS